MARFGWFDGWWGCCVSARHACWAFNPTPVVSAPCWKDVLAPLNRFCPLSTPALVHYFRPAALTSATAATSWAPASATSTAGERGWGRHCMVPQLASTHSCLASEWAAHLASPPTLVLAPTHLCLLPPYHALVTTLSCSAEGYGYSDQENVCFACKEGCASCTETSCSYCLSGYAFADSSEKACTKVRGAVVVGVGTSSYG